MATAEKIMLGAGTVAVDGVPIGLTRGGSSFVIEREFRMIEADGDRGPVKGRIALDTETAKLTVNALELFTAANMTKYYPAININADGSAEDVMTGTLVIAAGDYNDVTFTGKTKDGKSVVVTVEDALNMGNLEWSFEDKNEVVPALEFTAAYDEDTRDTPPWEVKFGKGTTYTVTYTVSDSGGVVEGATVNFNSATKLTNASGVAAFTGVQIGNNQPFSIVKGGYTTYYGSVSVVNADVPQAVTIVAIA